MEYRKEIDGLRAIAVLVVILFHAKVPGFSGGYVGVDVFFVLSGYLISTLLLLEFQRTSKISYFGFVTRRARRILPALFFVIIVAAIFAWILMTPKQLRDFAQSVVATLAFSSNILFWFESGYFDPAAETKPLLHTWSLAIEEQFYILYPVLLGLILRFKLAVLKTLVWLLTLVGIVLSAMLSKDHPEAAFFLTPMRAWGILIGVLVAIDMHEGAEHRFSNTVSANLAIVGFLCLLLSIVFFDEFTIYPGVHALLPVIGTALILRFLKIDSILGKLLSVPLLVWVGLLSYSLYLWHQPMLVFSRMVVMDHLNAKETVVVLLLTVMFSYISLRFVESPFRNKSRVSVKMLFSTILILSAVLIGGSFFAIEKSGDLGRYDDAALERLEVLKKANSDRQKSILADICHYSNRTGIGIDNYITQWNCIEQPKVDEQKILVTGDSHSADIVVAFRQNNYSITQLTGAGCSLDPNNMTPECRKMYKLLLPKVESEAGFDKLVISNRYEGNEVDRETAERVWNFWRQYAEQVVILTSAVEFPTFDRSVAVNQDLSGRNYKLPHPDANEHFDFLEEKGFIVLDRKSIFCSLTNDCTYRSADGDMLMVDPTHLSDHGAKLFGSKLLDKI